jgi:small nuclear ribonucleoprotein (snRNP)-like protein
MLKKYLAMSLIILMFNFAGSQLLIAQNDKNKDDELAAKIKSKITKSGVGEKSKVKVELKNQTKLEGYVSAIEDDSFTVTDKKTGTSTEIKYDQVKKVSSKGLSTAAKIGIAVGIAVSVTILLTLLNIRCNNEGGCF